MKKAIMSISPAENNSFETEMALPCPILRGFTNKNTHCCYQFTPTDQKDQFLLPVSMPYSEQYLFTISNAKLYLLCIQRNQLRPRYTMHVGLQCVAHTLTRHRVQRAGAGSAEQTRQTAVSRGNSTHTSTTAARNCSMSATRTIRSSPSSPQRGIPAGNVNRSVNYPPW
jgi:hypothetical protein